MQEWSKMWREMDEAYGKSREKDGGGTMNESRQVVSVQPSAKQGEVGKWRKGRNTPPSPFLLFSIYPWSSELRAECTRHVLHIE